MGFFDNLDDPKKQALLMMGLGLMQGAPQGRKNFGADFANAGLMGLQGYNSANQLQLRSQEEKQQQEMRALAMAEAKRRQDRQARLDALPGQFNMPGNLTPNDDEGNLMPPAPQGMDWGGYANAVARIDPREALAMQAQIAQLGAKERLKLRPSETVGTYRDGRFVADYTAPGAPEKAPEGFTRGPAGLQADPGWMAAQKELKIAGRQPVAPVERAPVMKDLIDPSDPTRMISVDARRYQGGTIGSPGVLGISGKEPVTAKREEQVGVGRETVSTLVAGLRLAYKELQEAGAIVDPASGSVSNTKAALAGSGFGQALGGTFGTENQSVRNKIKQQRPLLMLAIKQATGGGRQMDSNKELDFYLKAATDPSIDVQANFAALDMLESLYGVSQGGKAPPQRRGTDSPGWSIKAVR